VPDNIHECMLVFPNAKINIGLNITEKRSDGFHNISSVFYPVNWTDALEITWSDTTSFSADGIAIPGNESENLCLKAFNMLSADYDLRPVHIHLLKAIPIGAGLGGGSADAAFTISTLNKLFDLNISEEKQIDYARRLGSDCAFFILNKPMYCYGKGDQFEITDLSLAGKWIVMVNPGIHISTVEAYSGVKPAQPETNLRTLTSSPVSTWKDTVRNDFEAGIFEKYPVLDEIKQSLYQKGALYAAMSGSGSTLYGIFESETDLSGHFDRYNVWQGMLN
jgi:4-diphosphocytidyl-2-C-methyl-D-erythritol kinase